MSLINYIVWAPNPEVFPGLPAIGDIIIRYYGVLFALAFITGALLLSFIFKKEGKPSKDVETLTIYLVISTLVGARLGHALFYEPEVYLRDPMEILQVWRGGLSTHGAAFGILAGLFFYVNYYINLGTSSKFPFIKFQFIKKKKEGQTYLWVIDRLVIVAAIAACIIRIGNFVNSDVVGRPTSAPMAVVFARTAEESILSNPAIENVNATKGGNFAESGIHKPLQITIQFRKEDFPEKGIRNYLETELKYILGTYPAVSEQFHEPLEDPLEYELIRQDGSYRAIVDTLGIGRHPSHLYEAFIALLLFVLLFAIWHKNRQNTSGGLLSGLFLTILFSSRFLIEFTKENQEGFELDFPLNMGQLLSIPFILIGIFLILRMKRLKQLQGTGS